MASELGRNIHQRIGDASGGKWQYQFQVLEGRAPGHAVVSQIIALIGDDADQIEHVEVAVSSARSTHGVSLQVIVWAKSVILDITAEAGETPITRVIPRRTLSALTLLSAPIVTIQSVGSDWTPTKVSLVYPALDVTLPIDSEERAQSDAVALFLPSLLADLEASY